MKPYLKNLVKISFGAILLFIFLAGGIFIIFTFGKSSYDTTSITNAGFAIFAGCASVCFAWSRTSDYPRDTAKIKQFGESLFLSALCFVIASLAKFIFLHKTELIEKPLLGYLNFLFPIINVLGAIMFLLAYINAWIAMLGLLKILFRKSLTRI
jgi:hypothetical protein